MRAFFIALSICVSSAAVSAAFFITAFQNTADYQVPQIERQKTVDVEKPAAPEKVLPPEIDLAALSDKGSAAKGLSEKRARGAYRVPIPRQNPFDRIIDISELTAVSGADLESQTAAIRLAPSIELAKEQIDEVNDDRVLAATGPLAPEALEDAVTDIGSLGLLGVIIDTALNNGGQQVNNNLDVGPSNPSVTIGAPAP